MPSQFTFNLLDQTHTNDFILNTPTRTDLAMKREN
jgi:hypothetical protein